MDIEKYVLEFVEELSNNNYNIKQDSNYSVVYNCLNGLKNYIKNNFELTLKNFEDASILISSTEDPITKIVYEFFLGYINYSENNNIYMLHNKNAERYAEKYNKKDFLKNLANKITLIKNGSAYTAAIKKDPLLALVKIGQAVAAEKNIDTLIKTIAEETKEAIQADRCTVFLYDKVSDELWSKVALGLESTELRFNSNQGLAGHVFQTGETINIKDAYSDTRFNKNIDKETGIQQKLYFVCL